MLLCSIGFVKEESFLCSYGYIMSFTSLKYDRENEDRRNEENSRNFDYRMNPPVLQNCNPTTMIGAYASQTPSFNPIKTNLESQLLGLGNKGMRDTVNDWTEQGVDISTLPQCTFEPQIASRTRGSLVSDIQIQRFGYLPYNPVDLAFRRPYIGLDSRQFLKDNLNKK